jgi:hypothetical protein
MDLVQFRLNSKLLFLNCAIGDEGIIKPHYYKFERGRLVALR